MKKALLHRPAFGLIAAAVCASASQAQSSAGALTGMRTAHPEPPTVVTGVQDIFGFVGDTTLAGGWDAFEAFVGTTMEVLDSGLTGISCVTSVPTPSGGTLGFCPAMERREIGPDWLTWSHGYMGEIFRDTGVATVTIEMPQGATAFDAYIQPFPFTCDTYVIEATSEGNLVVTIAVGASGFSGAKHFGFYTTGGEIIDRVEITAQGFGSGYAIGELRSGPPAVGTGYCTAAVHSGGAGANMSATGGPTVMDTLNLRAQPVTVQPGLFIYSVNPQQTPFCNGFLCVGPGIVRIQPPALALGGVAKRSIVPAAQGITTGVTNFQYWFRDPAGGGAFCNLSDGLAVSY